MVLPRITNGDAVRSGFPTEPSAGPSASVSRQPGVTHLSDEALKRYWAGTVSDCEEAEIAEHLLFCPECAYRAENEAVGQHGSEVAGAS
jgi:hypothetical protein